MPLRIDVVPGLFNRHISSTSTSITVACPRNPQCIALTEFYLLLAEWSKAGRATTVHAEKEAGVHVGGFQELELLGVSWVGAARNGGDTWIQRPTDTMSNDDTLEPLHQWLVRLRQDEPFRVAIDCVVIEALGNAAEHSESTVSPVIIATTQQNPFRLEFSIADAGIGVMNSLRQNDKYKTLATDTRAVELALEEGVSSKLGVTRGGGLPSICRAIAARKGKATLISGSGEVAYDATGTAVRKVGITRDSAWPGTQLFASIPYRSP